MKLYKRIEPDHPIAPSIFYLITSHHPPCQLNRTWRINLFGHRMYICTRCLGQYIGFVFSIFCFWGLSFRIQDSWTGLLYFGLLPLPSTGTWLVQTVLKMENQNSIRVLSGFLFGVSTGIAFGHFILLDMQVMLIIIPIYGLYLSMVMLLLRTTNSIPKYLAPYEDFLHLEESG